MNAIARNWDAVQARVGDAATRAGRSPDEITVVVVTKTRSAEEVAAALRAGVTDVGENRVQEAASKRSDVPGPARWHLVGQLQRNKVGKAVDVFDVVQSVDNERLAEALARRATGSGRTIEILLQVNTSGAAGQGGVEPESLAALAESVSALDHLDLRGLMTIAAHSDDTESVRRCFRRLRELGEQLRDNSSLATDLGVLSMGMSGDFELAIEEGATMVRIGSAIFGPRS